MKERSRPNFLNPRFILGVIGLLVVGGSCGSSKTVEFKPVVSQNKDGVLTTHSLEEAESVCKENYCEPNQIYSAYFGRRRSEPAAPPAVDPVPVQPKPASPPSGTLPGNTPEKLDYSRALLGMPKAWAITEGSPEIIVAVLDTGVDITHPDLKENIWVNKAEQNGKPGVDDDGNGYADDVYGWDFANGKPNAIDDNGHGTHCAGIIAAEKNSIGSRGIAPNVKIMPLKFLSANGSGDTKNAVDAIHYAVKMGAKIISNSWGGGGKSDLLDQAIQDARKKGVIVIAAAGNESSDNDESPSYPAGIDGVVSVGSSTSSDGLSDFSNFGKKSVTIIAPGSSIYSTYLGGTYKTLSGTSMATPQVAGAIALAESLRGDLDEKKIIDLLCSTSHPGLRTSSKCGRMNVAGFIDAVSTIIP